MRRAQRVLSVTAVALALLASGHLAVADRVGAAPLGAPTAQYPGLHPSGTVTLGGPGYAHGYGDSNRGYGNLPGHGTAVGTYGQATGAAQPLGPSPAEVVYTPPGYYHQYHPGPAHGCPGVFPC